MWNENNDQDSVNDEYYTTASIQYHKAKNSKGLTLSEVFLCCVENECEKMA
jgi:hypothetical protein